MKLRNKQTGEIGYLYANKNENYNVLDENGKVLAVYTSLKGVVEEWEDVPEEPKEFWYISQYGDVRDMNLESVEKAGNLDVLEQYKKIGNYFETKEEAEKAVKKLNAWERLQKKFNFHITGWDVVDTQVIITTDCDFDYVKDRQDDGLWSDLDLVFNGNLLFGGEE